MSEPSSCSVLPYYAGSGSRSIRNEGEVEQVAVDCYAKPHTKTETTAR